MDGDPDGALMCRNCEYYERQYSSEWYAYAAWYLDKDYVVTINE